MPFGEPKGFTVEEVDMLDNCPLLVSRDFANKNMWYVSYRLIGYEFRFSIPSTQNHLWNPTWLSDKTDLFVRGEDVFNILSEEDKKIMVFHMDIFRW